jgi:plasmid stabilization system protein ParE
MSFTIIISPEADEDVISACEWYDSQSFGLGARFAHAVIDAIDFIEQHALTPREVFNGFRKVKTKFFPYHIYYTVENTTVVVQAIFHAMQNSRRQKLLE